jgi:2-oxoisovalerate dehydrogenase E1 component
VTRSCRRCLCAFFISATSSADVLDLRTLQPLDTEAIFKSVRKTGRVVIYQEDSMFGGVASDISAMIMEECLNF